MTAVIRQYSQAMSQAGRPDEKVKVSDDPTAGTEAAALFAENLADFLVDAHHGDPTQEIMQGVLISFRSHRKVNAFIELG